MSFKIGKIYTFNTLAPAVLGVIVKNARLTGIVDYSTACKHINVDMLQRNVYPLLPAGTPNITSDYTYYLFKGESGNMVVLADVWIEETSIEEALGKTISISIPNANLEDVTRIRDTLNLMGFVGYKIVIS